jgi:hypothetical protein
MFQPQASRTGEQSQIIEADERRIRSHPILSIILQLSDMDCQCVGDRCPGQGPDDFEWRRPDADFVLAWVSNGKSGKAPMPKGERKERKERVERRGGVKLT